MEGTIGRLDNSDGKKEGLKRSCDVRAVADGLLTVSGGGGGGTGVCVCVYMGVCAVYYSILCCTALVLFGG